MSTVSSIWLQENGTTCSREGKLARLAKNETVCQDRKVSVLFLCKAVFYEVSPAIILSFHAVTHWTLPAYRNSRRSLFYHVLRQCSKKKGLLMGFLRNQLQVNVFSDFIWRWRIVGPASSIRSTAFCLFMLQP